MGSVCNGSCSMLLEPCSHYTLTVVFMVWHALFDSLNSYKAILTT